MGFAPSKPWKWPCITHSDGCRNRKPPIDSAEQGNNLRCKLAEGEGFEPVSIQVFSNSSCHLAASALRSEPPAVPVYRVLTFALWGQTFTLCANPHESRGLIPGAIYFGRIFREVDDAWVLPY